MNVTPVIHLSREIAKTIFEEKTSLPLPAVPIPYTNVEPIVGKYLFGNEDNKVLDISVEKGELFLTVPKTYGAIYKFKLVAVSHDSTKTTFLTEMINEQLVFYNSMSGEIGSVQYMDCTGKNQMLNKAE